MFQTYSYYVKIKLVGGDFAIGYSAVVQKIEEPVFCRSSVEEFRRKLKGIFIFREICVGNFVFSKVVSCGYFPFVNFVN